MASANMASQLVSSEDVAGTNVYGAGDAKVGEIDHLMIDKLSGKVSYAVMSFGGFLGMGESQYAVPWHALKYDTQLGGYRTGITEEQLKSAPEYADTSLADRSWEQRTHEHYGVPPYWSQPAI